MSRKIAEGRKQAAKVFQNAGMTRAEARRTVYGPTRREATSHPTRRQQLHQIAEEGVRARRRTAQDRAAFLRALPLVTGARQTESGLWVHG